MDKVGCGSFSLSPPLPCRQWLEMAALTCAPWRRSSLQGSPSPPEGSYHPCSALRTQHSMPASCPSGRSYRPGPKMIPCQLPPHTPPPPPTQGVLIWKLLPQPLRSTPWKCPLCFSVKSSSEGILFQWDACVSNFGSYSQIPFRGVKPGFNPTSSL